MGAVFDSGTISLIGTNAFYDFSLIAGETYSIHTRNTNTSSVTVSTFASNDGANWANLATRATGISGSVNSIFVVSGITAVIRHTWESRATTKYVRFVLSNAGASPVFINVYIQGMEL